MDLYKVNANQNWVIEHYGHWNRTHGLQVKHLPVKAIRRLNLNGQEIRIGWVMEDNSTLYKYLTREEPHIDGITKACMETAGFLFHFLNASQKNVIFKSWGTLKNNTWDGMTGHLAKSEIDLGGTPMFIVPERFSFVQYTLSPAYLRPAFVFKQPPLSYTTNIFLLSFQKSLWYGIGVLLGVIFVLLCITTVWEWKKVSKSKRKDNDMLRPKASDVGMLVVGATCQQGSPVQLKGISGRIVLILLFLVLTFLYTSFCANIVALLQSSSVQIKTLQDLLDSKLKFGVEKAVWVKRYFMMETEPVRKALYEKKIAPRGNIQNFVSLEQGVMELKKGQFVFHMILGTGYRAIGKYLEEHEKCNLYEIPYLRLVDPYVAVRKGSPYFEMYKIGYERIQEHGLQNKLNRIMFTKKPKCSGRHVSFLSVSLVDCEPAFLVLAYGALIAVLVAIFENIYFRVRKCNHKCNHF
ncbi:uncharacterized protein LOC121726134 [Aricia agestis]|uniref:uncharacterized protein LOC121726134 n=1 Tax=Aricia agestis TaxID=91739 RepID=UPI001C208823|nr:uncharacterized protein LOC121726134 [Aricia agestis]